MKNFFFFILTLCLFYGNPHSLLAQEYKTLKVAEGVYSFGDGMYYVMFIVSDKGVIVADSVSPAFADALMKGIREVTDKPVKYLIYSHDHWDHISGGKVFRDAGATILSHVETKNSLKTNLNPNVVLPDKTWKGKKYTVKLGNKKVELLYFGPNHGKGMTVYRLPKEKIIYIVDLVAPKRVGFTFMPDFSPKEWLRSLKEIEELDFDIALFSHMAPKGTVQDIVAQRVFIEDLKAEIIRRMRAGEDPFMIPSNIKLDKYKDWAMYNEWLEMNAWRMLMEMHMGW